MALPKPTKSFIEGHLALFIITFLAVVIGIIWTGISTKYFVHPGGTWAAVILLSIGFLIFTYEYSYRDDAALAAGGGPQFWHYLIAFCIYCGVVFAINASVRGERVDNCIPKDNLSPEKTPQAWIDWYRSCPNSQLLIDAPAEDYILTNHKKPFWLMDKSGYTSDPVGWWKWYNGNPKNPYPLTDAIRDTLYNTNYLPKRLIQTGQ